MAHSILYLGDTTLQAAAAYLAGLIHHWDWTLDYVPSDQLTRADLFDRRYELIVLSDYPAAHMSPDAQRALVRQVEAGTGLLMIGGWESYHGCGGDWDQTPVAEALPVQIDREDDRVNCDHPVLLQPVGDHEILAGLPWRTRPPLIGGLNRFTPKAAGSILLQAHHFRATATDNAFAFEQSERDPLLVIGAHGSGRTAALATDVAPHWVGCLVDWGPERVCAGAPGAEPVEVGNLYAQFFHQLLKWTGNMA